MLLPLAQHRRPKEPASGSPEVKILTSTGQTLRRVGLFCENRSKYSYTANLASAFKARGVNAVAGDRFLNGSRFPNFIEDFKPNFVFEINRSKNQISNCDAKFHQIAWIQDHSIG